MPLRRSGCIPLAPKLLVAEDFGATGVLRSSCRSGNSSSRSASSLFQDLLISLLLRFFPLVGDGGSGREAHVSVQSLTPLSNCTESEDPAASLAAISITESSSSLERSGVGSGAGSCSRPACESGDSCCPVGRVEDEPVAR